MRAILIAMVAFVSSTGTAVIVVMTHDVALAIACGLVIVGGGMLAIKPDL